MIKYVLIGFTHPQAPNWDTKMVHEVFGDSDEERERAIRTYRDSKEVLAHVGLLDIERDYICDTTGVSWIGIREPGQVYPSTDSDEEKNHVD